MLQKLDLTVKYKRLDVQRNKRILVTGDIHGHPECLKGVLDRAGFSDEDTLVILGDIVEKGPDSLGALRLVIELCESGNVIPIIGNVDAFRLKIISELSEETAPELYDYIVGCRKWWGSSFYEELAAECGYALNSAEDVLCCKDAILSHFKKELDFLAALPTVVETQNFIFVHGGLVDKNAADNVGRSVFELTKYDSFLTNTPHAFDKLVVVGHWPVALYNGAVEQHNPLISCEKGVICIDGGCGVKSEGQLNLLIIPSIDCKAEEISYLSYDGLKRVVAEQSQEGGEESVYISWINRRIAVKERGVEFSTVFHPVSGRTLSVPNEYLISDTECMDYTDHVLSVSKGDRLSVVFICSKGIIAKKDGVVGWYYGRYTEE